MTANAVFPLSAIAHANQAMVDKDRARLLNLAILSLLDAGLQQFRTARPIHTFLDGVPVDFAQRCALASKAFVSNLLAAPAETLNDCGDAFNRERNV